MPTVWTTAPRRRTNPGRCTRNVSWLFPRRRVDPGSDGSEKASLQGDPSGLIGHNSTSWFARAAWAVRHRASLATSTQTCSGSWWLPSVSLRATGVMQTVDRIPEPFQDPIPFPPRSGHRRGPEPRTRGHNPTESGLSNRGPAHSRSQSFSRDSKESEDPSSR